MSKEYKYNAKIAGYLAEIMSLAYEVNCKTGCAVFVDFHGHVDKFEIGVGLGKEKGDWNNEIGNMSTYLSHFVKPKEVNKKLENTIAGLKKILLKEVVSVNLLA